VFFGIKYAIPAMVANGGGSIVNLSSIAGIIGSEHVHMAYNASKAAVRLMTKSVAVQHAKDKIRANSVHPGIMPPMRTSGRTADPSVRAERMRSNRKDELRTGPDLPPGWDHTGYPDGKFYCMTGT
jgi:NAD(P)-dependent dehydrogenase (short-subunit alcohol dehydrogenase family)